MDELLKNIWTAEEGQAMAAAMVSGPSGGEARSGALVRQPSLQRQNNLSLPRTLSRKTVDEVWTEIQRKPEPNPADKEQRRQGTWGEMTLEDFLVRAGVVREDGDVSPISDGHGALSIYSPVQAGGVSGIHHSGTDTLPAPSLQADWMNYASRHQQQQLLHQVEAAAAAAKMGSPSSMLMLPGNPMYDGRPDGAGLGQGSLASGMALSPIVPDFSMRSRKRIVADVEVEKTVERRQKRMIKNRESAARSRARKQAYTVELEDEVTHLKEENARLKKQQDWEIDHEKSSNSQHLQIRVLRRTRSW